MYSIEGEHLRQLLLRDCGNAALPTKRWLQI